MKKGLALLLLALTLVPLVPAQPARASHQYLWWNETGDGQFQQFAAGSSIVIVQGQMEFVNLCKEGGVNDYIWPATDVYVIPAGEITVGTELEDANSIPNTIIAPTTQGMFINEQIGNAASLDEGQYAVIYDECQDGKLDPGDFVLNPGFEITEGKTDVPLLPSFADLKQKAAEKANEKLGQLGEKMDDWIKAKGKIDQSPLGKLLYGKTDVPLTNHPATIIRIQIMNMAKHYLGIAADPPDPSFRQVTVIEPTVQVATPNDDAVLLAAALVGTEASTEAGLAEALLHALERYQGAELEDSGKWALIHARAIRDYATRLQQQVEKGDMALMKLDAALQADTSDVDGDAAEIQAFIDRVRATGFTPEELREAWHLGMTDSEIAAYKAELLAIDLADFSEASLRTTIADLRATNTGLMAALEKLAVDINANIVALENDDFTSDRFPVADAGNVYTGIEGEPLTLNGSAASPTAIVSYKWDLDGDGAFDDATGAQASVTFTRAYKGLVALQVTNSANLSNVAFARVDIQEENRRPQITNATPEQDPVAVEVGTGQTFTVTIIDPDDDASSVEWFVDGQSVANTASFTYNPKESEIGRRRVEARVTDNMPLGGTTTRGWAVAVRVQDGDGDGWRKNIDCDDTNPAINPGATEIVGNGKDDDCNPSTSDDGAAPSAAFTTAKAINRAQFEDGASIVGYSSVYNTQTMFRPENAIDSSVDTFWQTASSQPNNQHITIKLAGSGPQVVSQVVLRGGGAETDVKNFRVLVSTTGTADADFHQVFSGTKPRDINVHSFNFAPVAAQYVRFVVVDNHGGSHTVVNDVDIRTRPHEGGIVSLREGPAASIAAFSSQHSVNYKAEHLLDDSPFTAWYTSYGQSPANQWVKVKLGGGKTYTITRVRLQGGGHWHEVKDFEIRVSTTTTDDAAFTTVFSGTRVSNDQLQEFTFDPVAAKYVQLFVKSNYGRPDYLGLTMFQVVTPEGINAARLAGVGAAVVATSGPAAPATAPELVIDYSPNGSWRSTGEPKNQWLKLALLPGSPHIIDRVKLQTEGGNNAAKDFEIRVSNATATDADFKTVVLTGTLTKDKHEHWFTFPPTEAKLVQVYLRNNYGDTSSIQLSTVQVYSPNMGGPTVSFDDHSADVDNTITGWQWAFGDGTTSTERHPTHTYAAPGTYKVSLTVTADDGRRATTTMPYTVLRSPTIEDVTWSPTQPKEDGSTVTFDATASSDVASLVDWRWQLPFEANEKTGKSTTSYFADSGELPVTLTVLDSQLLQRKLTKTVNVENLAPTVNAGPDKQVVWGQAWNTNIWNVATTQSIEVSDPSSKDRTTLSCTWNFGNGDTKNIQPCTSSTARVVQTYATPGTYTATLTATDKDGATTSDTLTATVDRRRISILIPRDQIEVNNTTATVNATVVDEFDPQASLVGKSIRWTSGAETKNVLVGAGNKVSLQLALPAVSNPIITAEFDGDSLYHPARAGRALGEIAGVRDSQGTDFWLMFNTNFINTGQELSLFVTGTKDTIGTVRIPGMGFTRSFTVTAGQVTTIPIPPTAASNNNVEAKAIHLESLDEVSVYGLNRIKSTTDAFMGLPVDALGTEYLVLGYNGWGSELGIVATENDTVVSLTFPQAPNHAPVTVELDRGQMYQFNNLPEVSGTSITSNKPVSVFGGHACTQIPINVPACDHVIEQIPPVETWGREFVTVPLATRKNGDTFRFLASRNGTTVSVNGSVVATLNRGQVHERIINGSSRIVASEPILVAQYANGQYFDSVIADPFMMLIPPYEQFQRSYTVTTPATGFQQNFINVVAPQSAIGGIKLDGALIPATQFAQIAGSDYYGAQVAVASGSHNVSASMPFGIFMYGFDAFDSYGYPGGASQAPVASVANVTLAPASATNTVGTEHCVTATVTDAQGQGLEDVRVDFQVTGSNPGTGFVTTNTAGQAQYCYTGTTVGDDSIVATVSTSSATASATWLSADTPPVAQEQTLATSEDTAVSVTLAASDAQNNTLTYTVVTQPEYGTLSGTAPNLTYTPASNFNGADTFTFKANDGTGDSNIATISITVQPVNDAPLADAKGPYTVDEGGAVVVEAIGSDVDDDALGYAWDLDGDGTFEHTGANAIFSAQAIDGPATRSVTVRATDASGLSTTAEATINVVNVAPTAELTNDGPVTEGGEATISFTDQVDPSTVDTTTGLRYAFACDDGTLSSATWANGSETASTTCTFDDGPVTYQIRARVIDADGGYTDYTTDVQVLSAPPTAAFVVPEAVDEGDTFTLELVNASDSSGADTAAGFSYAFDCGNGAGFGDFGASNTESCTADASGSRTVQGQVRDKDGTTTLYTAEMVANSVPPSVGAPVVTPGPSDEGAAVIVSAGFTSRLANSGPFTCSIDFDDSSELVAGVINDGNCIAPSHTYQDNGWYTVSVMVTNKAGATGTSSVVHKVNNVAPVVGAITAPLDPVKVNTAINVQATFTDAGALDTHTAEWTWGDGTTTSGTINGEGTVGGSHTYTTPGVYAITLTVTDKDSGVGTQQFEYVVVYDPEGGFVTGGGRIESPEGAYTANPELTGRANFGFVSKYQKGSSVPTGQTQFQFQMAGLNFHSTAYDWLVISGAKAQYKGTGTINGEGAYGFLLTATDGQVSGGGGVDKFRIKIWDKASGAIIYDNQMGADDSAGASQAIDGGSIVIHSK